MSELKANHICKNPDCNKGKNGGRSHYYACDYCGKTQNWRSIGCCMDCYNAYIKLIMDSRPDNNTLHLYPERTDMTYEEIVALVNDTPIDVVKRNTMAELAQYKDEIDAVGLGKTIDQINQNIRKNSR